MDSHRGLASIAWQHGELDESIFHWQHLLAIDNCSEDAHHGLMRCYTRQGKRGMALRQYQYCVDILKKDLDVSPGAAIKKFYQHLTAENS